MGTYTGSDKRLQYLFQNGGGGGGGTTVIANPQGQATDTLNKLQVGTTIYSVSGGGSSGHSYSTQEQVIGTWTDGKPLYEKTVVIPQSAMSTDGAQRTYAIVNDIPNGVIRHCFGMAVSAIYGNCTLGSYSYRQNTQGGSWWLFCWYYNLLALRSSNGVNDIINTIKPDITVTVQYTKTTD